MEGKIITAAAVIIGLFIIYVLSGTLAWTFLRFEYKMLFKWMVFRIGYKKPKKIFCDNQGNYYLMNARGVLDRYKSYHILPFTEKKWLYEMKSDLEKTITESENKLAVIEASRKYYNITGRLDGVVGAKFLRAYITEKGIEFPTNLLRELMGSFVYMTIYMVKDDLAVRKDNLMWALELLRKMIKSEIVFSEELENIYVIDTENGKEYVKEWWLEGARLYSIEDERDAIRYLINMCKGGLGELMYYGSGFTNDDVVHGEV